jgi:hypothetical protein
MLVSDSGLITQPMVRSRRRYVGFQWLMAIWERTAPYNAATLIEISPDISVHEIDSRWQAVLRQLDYTASPLSIIDTHSEIVSEGDATSAWLTHELCRGFRSDDVPFRLSVIRSPGRLWIRLGYRHIYTDGWTIALILKRLLGTECSGAPAGRTVISRRKQSVFRSIVLVCGEFLRAGSPERRSSHDRELITAAAASCSLKSVQSLAVSHEVSLNDLILGTVADAISEVKPDWTSQRRPRTLIQVPVNVRESSDQFMAGQFIGSWIVSVPEGTYIEKLRAVSGVTAKYKSSGEAFNGLRMIDIVGAMALWAPTRFANWCGRKIGPLAAIVSNLDYSQYFSSESSCGKVLSYTRTASPGELAPLVITVTSLGDTLDVRATAWTNSVSAPELDQIVEAIERRIDNQR